MPQEQIDALRSRNMELEHLIDERTTALDEAHRRARAASALQASVNRLLAEITSMHRSEDLQRITPLIWRELTTLGIPFFRCGAIIVESSGAYIEVYLSTPESKPLPALKLNYGDHPIVQETIDHWQRRERYTARWDAKGMQDWMLFLQDRGLIRTPERYLNEEAPPPSLNLHAIPFAQGMLYVGCVDPLDDEGIATVQALADTFAVAYARYLDFHHLEAGSRELEQAQKRLEQSDQALKAIQQQLIHAEKMASLGEMTAGIAHEIKNPLNFINNFAEVNAELAVELQEALDEALPPEELKAILGDMALNAQQIAKHGKRADSIVRGMMQHARGGTGEQERVVLNTFVEEYLDLAYHGMRARVPDFNVTLERAFGEDVGETDIVPQELGRVLVNLLGNAFDAVYSKNKASEAPYDPVVRVQTSRTGDGLEIRIADNGPGIPQEIQARIFEPFFTTKPTGSGTGLGLSLSYDIVTEGHGGTLAVESAPGQGATFIITLPG